MKMIKLLFLIFLFIGATFNPVTSQSAYVPNIFKFNFPWVRSSSYISFLLFTRENTDDFETLKPKNVSNSLFYEKDRPTKIIVHGFGQSAQEQIYLRIKDAYLKEEDFNILIVDWELARRFSYSVAAAASEFVAKEIALFLRTSAISTQNVHLIGFSLGAHIVGMVGRELKGEIERITGLDPVHPLFRFVDKRFKLDETDAKFVDVIHTDGGDSFWEANHMGIASPLGHADFYPNKGIYQPGCPKSVILNPEDIECSHLRVLSFFAESIENKGSFMACKCNSWKEFENGSCKCDEESQLASMGEPCAKKSQGKYYLKTNPQFPYGLGPSGVLETWTKKRDSGYPLLNWSMTQIPYNNDEARRRYNRAQTQTRRFVECAFWILKRKFSCLNHLSVTPEDAVLIIMACWTIHNLTQRKYNLGNLIEMDNDGIDENQLPNEQL